MTEVHEKLMIGEKILVRIDEKKIDQFSRKHNALISWQVILSNLELLFYPRGISFLLKEAPWNCNK